jgi:SAM-dependent methyltransferase
MASLEREEVLRHWYTSHYNCLSASANGSPMERYLHRAMERPHGPGDNFDRVLEVGANNGEHMHYVRHQFRQYWLTDISLPQIPSHMSTDRRICVAACDAAYLPFRNREFDRVIATCLLHHVDNPLRVFQELCRVTRPGGIVTLMIPTDPSFAYRAGVWLTSRRAARRAGLEAEMDLVKALDHRNHYRSIATQGMRVLADEDVSIEYLPFRVPSVELNAFTVWQVTCRPDGRI